MFNPADLPGTITAIATLVAAIGALIVSVLNSRRAAVAADVAEKARLAAEQARLTAESSAAEIVTTKEGVFEIGRRIDGRLSELLEVTRTSERAKGRAEGRAENPVKSAQKGGRPDGS